ncbi:restriction endonuclease subunit S [Eubacterium sp. AF19-12LB]|uniref:restriction endonuclease subunit S n=1 Tax=Eubacterium sp. AF19-12LB TaxID=2293106 RepID=UPI000E4F93AA|nr:restriction endonuclease subunit S [Eubacterium sp. AF19-12LB]RHR36993.1 restriction endonuclease subunit S [Eubacterium sp. AF19-12LB]
MKNDKKPQVRFKGFNDDWEQRKVGEFLTESRESGHKGDVAHKMTVKLWGKGVYEKNETGSANTQYFTRHAGQFIYSKLDFLNCAFGVVPEELDSLETTADVPAFDCDGVNPYFMFYTAIQPIFYEKNGMIADGSRKAKRIHANTFLEMPFFVPSLTEQNKIVNLLSELDHLITLHQRKCDKLQKIKKSMLEKMFPQNGMKKPEIRFKGFNDDWEQRKVSETAEIAAGGTPSTSVSEYWEPKEVPWLSSGEVHKKYVTYTDDMISKLGLSNSSAKMIKENSILIALAGQGKTRGTVAINRISLSTNQSIAAMTFNDDIIPEFVFSNLENRYDEIRAMSSGDGSRGGLNKQLVGNIVIPYTIIEEQRKIGAYFENLDNLITLHQRKLEKLKYIKKSMLENMFV